MHGENRIRGQYKDVRIVLGRLIERVVVKLHIPHTGCGVEWLSGLSSINEALFCRCMSTNESSKIVSGESFALEERDKIVGAVVDIWKKAVRSGSGSVFTADIGPNAGTFRT